MIDRIFLNVSNHPASKWSEDQIAAAEVYGEIIDFPFPAVNPSSDKAEVQFLAAGYLQTIQKLYPGSELTVHIMGEQTFCHALVCMLERAGIRCVASCSERNVAELPDGRKLSDFRFVRFREY